MKLDLHTLQRYDKNNMYGVYDKWPELAISSYESNFEKMDLKEIEHVVFAGMGGSGIIGDTVSSILSKTNMHVNVVKGFHLPNTVDSSTLVVATSASGNTVETLAVINKAKDKGCKIVSFSSGGKMMNYCHKNKIKHVKIPLHNSPRASFPVFFYSMINVLDAILQIKKNDVLESISLLEKTRKKIYSSNLNVKTNPSLNLAYWLSEIPIIYYPAGLQAVGIRFKNSIQENVKIHAMAEDIIEACHNGIVAWETPSHIKPILIRGRDDYIKTKQLWMIIKEFFNKNDIEFREVHSVRGSILSKIVNLVYLLDYASIYAAIIKKIDPTPVQSIDFIKSKIK